MSWPSSRSILSLNYALRLTIEFQGASEQIRRFVNVSVVFRFHVATSGGDIEGTVAHGKSTTF
jgi:hypothetical protein